MENVLTLIADPEAKGLTADLADDVRTALAELGADTQAAQWLAPDVACDISFGMMAPDIADAAARKAIKTRPVDVVAQPSANRRKTLLVADMDSTMVQDETLDELAAFAGPNMKTIISAITARAMNGEIDFKEALRQRVGHLKALNWDALESTYERIRYTPGARRLVQTMKKNGAYTVLVSGGFKFFTSRVARACGFDVDVANDLEMADGFLTGQVIEPILDRDAKLALLIEAAAHRQIPLSMACAVGDGANDLDMIKAAGLGVAFHAKPVVAAEARVRIEHCRDLTALLYAQGYHQDELV